MALPGAVRLKSSNHRLTCAGAMRFERLRSEGGKEPTIENVGYASPGRGLVPVEMRRLPRALDEFAERRDGARGLGCRVPLGARPALVAFPANLVDAFRGHRSERDPVGTPARPAQQDVALPAGGPDPDPEAGHPAVPDGIFPLAGTKAGDGRVGEPAALRFPHGRPPSTAPIVSAASIAMASAECVYLRVVSGLAWPSSLPIARTVSPRRSAMLACVCRRS